MVFCAKCGVEMRCVKTGCGVDFGNGHVYAGDRFECQTCGANVVKTNPQPYHDPEYKGKTEYVQARGVIPSSRAKIVRNLLVEDTESVS